MNESFGRRTRIKFCGMCCEEDIRYAVHLGVDAIGFVHVEGSPRWIGLERAAALRRELPPFVACVALMRNPSRAEVDALVKALDPDLIQFHGDESPSFCASLGQRYIKAIAMGGVAPEKELADAYPDASAILLDGHPPGGLGGQGKPFDWNRAKVARGQPLIVAGGLHENNVGEVIRHFRPYAVDVSSGIEGESRSVNVGAKDWNKMEAFVDAVRRADAFVNVNNVHDSLS